MLSEWREIRSCCVVGASALSVRQSVCLVLFFEICEICETRFLKFCGLNLRDGEYQSEGWGQSEGRGVSI